MKSTTSYKPGDVVLISFPFTDLTAVKFRPCLILSSARFNRTHDDFIAAAITSHVPDQLSKDEYLFSPKEQKLAGLPKPSIIKLGKVVTLHQGLARRVLGRLPKKTMTSLYQGLYRIISHA